MVKIKVRPEDFIVREKLKFNPAKKGKYVVYRIEKRGWGTLELLSYIKLKYRVEIKHAGLKDKNAFTVQYGTSLQDYPVIKGDGFLIQKVGYWWVDIGPSDIEENLFTIRIRDLEDAESLAVALEKASVGFPNYFDEQRFGSRTSEGLIGEMLLRGEGERALFLYMTNLRSSDTSEIKELKKFVRSHWRQWEALEKVVPPVYKPIFRSLKEEGDFLKAWGRFPRSLLSIILSAVQSYYWNILLSRRLEDMGARCFVRIAGDRLACTISRERFTLPTLGNDEASLKLYRWILQERGIERLRVKELDFKFRSKEREGFVDTKDLEIQVLPDELYPGKKSLLVNFALPPGSYATTFLKVAEALGKNKKAGLPGFEPGSDG